MKPRFLLWLLLASVPAYSQSYEGDYDLMHRQAITYYQNAQYQEAILLAQEALPLIEEEYGKIDEDYTAVLALLIEAHRKNGQPEEAEAIEDSYVQELQNATNDEDIIRNQHVLYALQMNKTSLNQDLSGVTAVQSSLDSISEVAQKAMQNGSVDEYMAAIVMGSLQDSSSGQAEALRSLFAGSTYADPVATPDSNPIENFREDMQNLGKEGITMPSRAQELQAQIEKLPELDSEELQQLEDALLEALQNAQIKGYTMEAQGLLGQLGIYYEYTEDYSQAALYYGELIEGYFQHLLPLIHQYAYDQTGDVPDSVKAQTQRFTRILDVANSFVCDYQTKQPSITGLMYDNILLGKGYLLETNRTMREGILASGDPNLLRTFRLYNDINDKIVAAQSFSRPEIDSLKAASGSLRQGLGQSVAQLPQVSWTDVRESLSNEEAAVEFIQISYFNDTQRRNSGSFTAYQPDSILYGALVLRPDDEYPHFVSLCTQTQLADLLQIDLHKEQITNSGQRGAVVANKFSQRQSDLYDLIWQPLEKLLQGTETVYYSPTGYLHQLPFASLPHPEGVLLERYKLNQVSNTRVLNQENHQQSQYPTSIALFGDVDYNVSSEEVLALVRAEGLVARGDVFAPPYDRTPETFSSLDHTQVEVEKIADQVKELSIAVDLYTGKNALEEKFKEQGSRATSPSILHAATHGFFLADTVTRRKDRARYNNALDRSGLVFAGANSTWAGNRADAITETEDGILLASEVAQLNLQNTELVVLSACETGLGQIQGNEGVYGLQRAFREAGARYLIMSLQGVSDQKTQELMTKFYEHWLIEKQPIRDAFRSAQLALLSNGDAANWSFFVLME